MINLKKIGKQKKLDYYLIAMTIAIGFYLGWSAPKVALLTFVVWQILFPIPSKILANATLLALLIFPIMIITNINNHSEDMGILIFCLLITTLIMTIIDNVKLDRAASDTKKMLR